MIDPSPSLRTFAITGATLCLLAFVILAALESPANVEPKAEGLLRRSSPIPPATPPRCRPVMPHGVDGSVSRGTKPWDLEMPDREPFRVKFTQPHFTREAWDHCVQGWVIAEVLVGPEGKVIDGRIEKGLPYGLDRMVAKEAKRWRYLPATKRNQRIPATDLVMIFFNPNAPEQAPEE